jgi:hypothetical protein
VSAIVRKIVKHGEAGAAPRAMTRFSSSSLDWAMRVKMEPSPGGVSNPGCIGCATARAELPCGAKLTTWKWSVKATVGKAAAVCNQACARQPARSQRFDGHGQFENGALAGRALDSDDAVHSLNQAVRVASPNPRPSWSRANELSTWAKGSKSRSRALAEMPRPVSRMMNSRRDFAIARAGACDFEHDLTPVGKSHGVVEQVPECTAQGVRIATE